MFIFTTGRAPRLSAATRLHWITAVLAAAASGVLAWAAVPAASAATIPVPGPGAAYGPAPAALPALPQVITGGGMPGWQITLIVIAAALVAATAAVLLDRARASRRTASTTDDARRAPARRVRALYRTPNRS